MCFANVFSQSVVCLCILLTLSFTEQNFLILMKSHLSIIYFMDHAFGVISKKSSPYPRPSRCSPMLSYRSFILLLLYLGLWSIVSYFLWKVYDLSVNSFFFFKCECPVSSPVVEKTVNSIVKDQLTLFMWVHFWVLCSLPLICMSVFVPILHCFDYYSWES